VIKIIAGKHQRQIIPTLKKSDYRPSTNKLREAVFSILLSLEYITLRTIVGSSVLDLFAGTGSFSFEALSRGAENITLIDCNMRYLKLIRKFAYKIGEIERVKILLMNATNLVRSKYKYDFVFIDPPYYHNFVISSLQSLVVQGWLSKGAVIVVKMENTNNELILPKDISIIQIRAYGQHKLLLLQHLV
jgi:16S rRNA (guanine966-N2)-methyltransferase